MPDLKNKTQLADAAKTLAQSFELVQRGSTTFIPVDWKTYSPDPPPSLSERIWIPMSRDEKQQLANKKSQILFSSDTELRSFDFMLRQLAVQNAEKISTILVKTSGGLRSLRPDGTLVAHDGTFTPNYVQPMLNDDVADKAEVFNVIVDWLGGNVDEAHSLLHHLATTLAPSYSAVKYVLLLGEGRNGKSVLLTMLSELFGPENVSNVTRQMMADRNPACAELNDKLLNVVFDGEMSYIKDSSMEKTLIAGEPGVVRLLYESGTTKVQTTALFIEALNQEPKARDKSSALQKRLVRFQFPNVYPIDKAFARRMTSEQMLGAFLSLLIDHYVPEEEIAAKLAPTQGSIELQMEQVWLGSPVLQFLEHVGTSNPSALEDIKNGGYLVDTFLASFKPWAETQSLPERSDADLLTMIKGSFELGWKTIRVNKKPTSRRTLKRIRPETLAALAQFEGDHSGTEHLGSELVGD